MARRAGPERAWPKWAGLTKRQRGTGRAFSSNGPGFICNGPKRANLVNSKTFFEIIGSDVNKDLGFKAKDLSFKAKDLSFKAKDLIFKAKAKDLSFKAQVLGLGQGQNFVQS